MRVVGTCVARTAAEEGVEETHAGLAEPAEVTAEGKGGRTRAGCSKPLGQRGAEDGAEGERGGGGVGVVCVVCVGSPEWAPRRNEGEAEVAGATDHLREWAAW